MRRDPFLRSDVFFLAILFSYLIAILCGVVFSTYSHLGYFQLGVVVVLAIGVVIKTIPSRLQKWFLGEAFKKKYGTLCLDKIPPMTAPMFPSYRDFPRKGVNGQFYYANDMACPYMWSDHQDRYLKVVMGGNINEDRLENFGSIVPQGASCVQPPWDGNLPPPNHHPGNFGTVPGQDFGEGPDGTCHRGPHEGPTQ